jgi:hypothetical protein
MAINLLESNGTAVGKQSFSNPVPRVCVTRNLISFNESWEETGILKIP